MPDETIQAVTWVLQQTYTDFSGKELQVTKDTRHILVDKIGDYFNTNNIVYDTFSYDDLIPFLSS